MKYLRIFDYDSSTIGVYNTFNHEVRFCDKEEYLEDYFGLEKIKVCEMDYRDYDFPNTSTCTEMKIVTISMEDMLFKKMFEDNIFDIKHKGYSSIDGEKQFDVNDFLYVQAKDNILYFYTNCDKIIISELFTRLIAISSIKELNMNRFIFTNNVMLDHFFRGNAELIDLSKVSFSLNQDLDYMFASCKNLKTVIFNQKESIQVQSCRNMFKNCVSLERIDLSSLDFTYALYTASMFDDCYNLNKVYVQDYIKQLPYGLQEKCL